MVRSFLRMAQTCLEFLWNADGKSFENPRIKDTVHALPDEAREEARRNPGGWVYKIEGNYERMQSLLRR
jgi:hypothetical protein